MQTRPRLLLAFLSFFLLGTYSQAQTTLEKAINNRVVHVPSVSAFIGTIGSMTGVSSIKLDHPLMGGDFIYDPTLTVFTSGISYAAKNTGGFKRIYSGPVDVRWFGAVGDALDATATKNTQALNAAVAYVSASGNAALGSSPVQKERPATLYIPAGTYKVNQKINVPGTIRIVGDGGLSYGGTFIYQIASNQHLFDITGSADGGNCAVQIEDLRLRGLGSGNPTANLINVDPSVVSANSLYFNRVWFQGWERFALSVGKTDDLQVTNCTFDGGFNYCFSVGGVDANHTATNSKFLNNTFYGIRGGIGYLGTVDTFTFSFNNVFGADGLYGENTHFGIDALNPGFTAQHLTISYNKFDHVENVFASRSDYVDFSHNTVTNTNSIVVNAGGGGTVRYWHATHNTITGSWLGTYTIGGQTIPSAPIWAYGTGVRDSWITGNTIVAAVASPVAVYAPDDRTHFCHINNIADGFTTANTVANPSENLIP